MSAARIEEEIIVTPSGAKIITLVFVSNFSRRSPVDSSRGPRRVEEEARHDGKSVLHTRTELPAEVALALSS